MANTKKNGTKTLIIVESPTKAKTIKKFLPSDYTVMACNGHVRDLPAKDLAIDVQNNYEPNYVVAKGKEKIIREFKRELATSSHLLLATDEDREGESISWHLVELLKPKVPYQRMVFHEITKKAILHALEHGRELDMDLVQAQEARRILDRLYGYTISPFLWRKLSLQNLSAGRVQSPGLRMIVERERQRMAFVSSDYWGLKADLITKRNESFTARLEKVGSKRLASGKDFDATTGKLKKTQVLLLDENGATELAKRLHTSEWKVVQIEEKEKKQRPAPPFITSTLQQEGSRKLRLSAKQTMSIAQKLYESGLITYMRTDSPSLSQEGIKAARDVAASLFGSDYLSPTSRQYSAKSSSAQEAHEAIRPAGETFVHPDKTALKGTEKALYDLIWKRTVASQMADAIKISTIVKIEVDDATFGASGNRIAFAGFIRAYVEGKDDPEAALEDSETFLPHMQEQESVELKSLENTEHQTKPPARFTEATVVQELEKQGIGRPSTYATIIDRLFEKAYVVKEGTALLPTFVGFAVVQLLEKHFEQLVEYQFTSDMESHLDAIAAGKAHQLDYLKTFYEGKQGLKEQVDEKLESVKPADAKRIEIPYISDPYAVMIGKYGPYISKGDLNASIPADVYPGTTGAEQLAALLEVKKNGDALESIGVDPDSGLPIYLLSGKFGPYFQLGQKSEENPKPKTSSVPKGIDPATMELKQIVNYLNLPRQIGIHPDTGKDVIAAIGRYGPYVGSDGEFRSLANEEAVFTVSLEEALTLLRTPKPGRRPGAGKRGAAPPLKEFEPLEGKSLGVFNGKYGFYGKWGKDNFTLPKEMRKDANELEKLTQQQMVELAQQSKK
ncbi:MAG: type I DNA topoisomerase [Sphaerochaetaceae bacterium]